MQIWKSCNPFLFTSETVSRRVRILTPFNFGDMPTLDIRNVCLQIYRNNRIRWKVAYFLRKIQTLHGNNSRILRIQNAIFSGYYFYMDTNIWRDFQICISVPLMVIENQCLKMFKLFIFNEDFFLWIFTLVSHIFSASSCLKCNSLMNSVSLKNVILK